MSKSRYQSEDEFLSWAGRQLGLLASVTIVSHTPLMLFEDEVDSRSSRYLAALKARLKNPNVKTKYYLSEGSLELLLARREGLISDLKKLRDMPLYVVGEGYFPNVSFWVGEAPDVLYAFVKISFEGEHAKPAWVRLDNNPRTKNLLVSLKKHSIPLNEYVKRKEQETEEWLAEE